MDRRLYALRDVTGTVSSVPLIAASIMSKKLAEGSTRWCSTSRWEVAPSCPMRRSALELARTMIGLGEAHGVRTIALLTAMDRPLGHACGNALEVEECLLALQGEGPDDLMEVTAALGVEMLLAAGVERAAAAARARLLETITSGAALRKFAEIIEAQGGNPPSPRTRRSCRRRRRARSTRAPTRGRVTAVHPRPIGHGVIAMGGGRSRVEDTVDPSVGFVITVRPGDQVVAGQPLATVYAADEAGLEAGDCRLARGYPDRRGGAALRSLVSHRVTARGVEPVGH